MISYESSRGLHRELSGMDEGEAFFIIKDESTQNGKQTSDDSYDGYPAVHSSNVVVEGN